MYEAKLYVQPPTHSEVAQLNYGRGGDTGLGIWTVKQVYEVYLRTLQSESVRHHFFRAVYFPALPEAKRYYSRSLLYSDYSQTVSVARATKGPTSRYVVTVSQEDPQQAAIWVARYAEMAADIAKQEVLKSNQSEMRIKADNIEQQISASRASARKEREDEITRLKEALEVADAIGLKRPPLISGRLSSELHAVMDGSLSYMRGTDALEQEIANLEFRPSDDPFIRSLREKQQAIERLRNLKVSPEEISVYQQDGAVDQSVSLVRPKRHFLLAVAALVAITLGGGVAVVRDQWLRKKSQA